MKSALISLAAILTMTLAAPAAITIQFAQVGNDVVATGLGSANITGLTNLTPDPLTGSQVNLEASSGNFRGGATGVNFTIYSGISGPANFGPGTSGNNIPTSVSGDYFGLTAFNGRLFVPGGYVSGTALSNTATWTNRTLANLGLSPVGSSFTYTWGSGANADSLTVAVVPEPSSALLVGLGAVCVALMRRNRASGAPSPKLADGCGVLPV
jgi:hypothetical protein